MRLPHQWLGLFLLAMLLGCARLESVRADPGQTASPPEPEVKSGFAAMEHPERLPLLLPNGTQTKQIASYDTAGGDADGEWPAAAWLRARRSEGRIRHLR